MRSTMPEPKAEGVREKRENGKRENRKIEERKIE
jgi:hypothetical protein